MPFQFRWLRNLIRNHSSEIPEQRAALWKSRLSYAYAFLAWNAFGFVVFKIYTGEGDWGKKYRSDMENSLTPAQQWSKTLGIKDAKVIKVKGFNVSNYEIHNDFDDEAEEE